MKTANEMFRELGYEKDKSECELSYANPDGQVIHYTKNLYGYPAIILTVGSDTVPMFEEEILACAQLIKEMEE